MQGTSARPTGITILAVLAAIFGVLGLLGSLAVVGLGGLGFGLVGAANAGIFFTLFGLAGLVLSIVELAFAYGAWTLKPWAWQLGLYASGANAALAVLNLVLGWSVITSAVISVAIAGVIIYYLMTPDVKRAFGKA